MKEKQILILQFEIFQRIQLNLVNTCSWLLFRDVKKFQLDNEENDLPVAYDVNSNVSSSGITESQRIPAEKPLESLGDKVQGVKTRKSTQDKARKKEKELDVFPRPQRQFTLEEMIEDMMPTDTESKESITVWRHLYLVFKHTYSALTRNFQ